MKWLIILVLLILLVIIILTRYRRQIQTVLNVWKMFKKIQQDDNSGDKQIEQSNNAKDVPLIRCAKCGIWIPQNNALNLRSKTFYCSAKCMQQAVVK